MVPGAWRNFCIALSNAASPEPFGSSLPGSAPGATPATTAFAAVWRLAGGQPYAGRLAAGRGDLGDLGFGEDLAAGRDQHLLQRADHGVGAALAEHHAKALVGHRFQIGEYRAAGDVGREVEMHAPGGKRRLDMGGLEILVEPGARRGKQQARHVERASDALLAPGVPCGAGERAHAHRRAEQPEQMLGFARKCGDQPAPGLGIGGRERGEARDGLLEIGADPEPASVGKGAGEAIGGGCKLQPGVFNSFAYFR